MKKEPRAEVRITNVDWNNVDDVKDFRAQKTVDTFHGYMEENRIGVYAWVDSQVVGHAWAVVCDGKSFKANGYFKLHNNQALIHFCNVKESCRG
ncbi:MAG: hypothetical protein ACYSRZ_03350 [Planctomycetota bacterium]